MKKYKILIDTLAFIGIGFIIFIFPVAIFSSVFNIIKYSEAIGKAFFSSVYFIQICIGQIKSILSEILFGLLAIGGTQILILLKLSKIKRNALHG